MKREVYHSTTDGPIPLSFTGRHLLQELREAVTDAIAKGDWHANGDAVSRARAKLAKYMSKLEGKSETTLGDLFGYPPKHYSFRCDGSVRCDDRFDNVQNYSGKPAIPVSPASQSHTYLHLPAIPEGYALHIAGTLVTIEPITQVEQAPLQFGGATHAED